MSGEPMDMRTSAVALHEYFTSLLAAGFTRREALYIVAAIGSGPRSPEDGEGT